MDRLSVLGLVFPEHEYICNYENNTACGKYDCLQMPTAPDIMAESSIKTCRRKLRLNSILSIIALVPLKIPISLSSLGSG